MKLLSFAIPCYNSKDYMEHCIESILPGGDDVEIIIVDDGSKDETAAMKMCTVVSLNRNIMLWLDCSIKTAKGQ